MSSPLFRIVAAAAALAAVFPATGGATNDVAGYLANADRRPVRDSSGDCWHTREWQRGMRFANCEPKLASTALPAFAAPPRAPVAPPPKRLAEAPRPAAKTPVPLRLPADMLFAFDSARLSDQGRATLDGLGKRIAAAGYRSVEIAGHADPLGAASYDRALSERRAEVVRDYLVGHGVDAKRMRTRGLGNARPPVALAQCAGLSRARLIQCLQPDRYAEVTVAGTMHTASAQ